MISGSMPPYVFGSGAVKVLPSLLAEHRPGWVLWLVDHFFSPQDVKSWGLQIGDEALSVDTTFEPTVESVEIVTLTVEQSISDKGKYPCAVIGIGGGSTMDTAKAVSILLTNPGKAADYQGWDLVQNPAIYKIGVPTISGTGSESSSTCVLTNHAKGLKLGMNSPYSRFDQVVLDPDLTATVPREQYFYTGMDTWFHCREYINGEDRNDFTDALALESTHKLWQVFCSSDEGNYQSDWMRSVLMVASFLGGSAVGCTGLVHPFSAGLSMVLGLRHGFANCIAMTALEEFYPDDCKDFAWFLEYNNLSLPMVLCASLSDEKMDALYQATIVHEKPLRNALGASWRDVLTKEKVKEIFRRM